MAIKFNRSQTFATNGTVTAAGLHNLVDGLDIYQALITDQTNLTSVGTADELLIADADLTANDAPRAVTVQELFDDALTVGTYTNAQFVGTITHGTSTGTRTVSSNASITTGTINNATLGTTTGTAATFTSSTLGTTNATAASITNGTIQTLTSSTATISNGTFGGSINSTVGTIGTLNSTTGTISNLSTTLAGDFTISQGTATLATTGVTAGTYGTSNAIPQVVVDAKGRVSSIGTFSSEPSDGSITPAKLSQPFTAGTAVTATGTAVDFTSIPSWANSISVIFRNISTSGSNAIIVQLGDSGGFETTGYTSTSNTLATAGVTEGSSDAGFIIRSISAANSIFGSMSLLKANPPESSFVSSHVVRVNAGASCVGGGVKATSGTFDRIRITTTTGTDTFDAGIINIFYQ